MYLGIFLLLNPSTTTVYAWSAFYPSLRFTLSLQSAFYTQSAFYPGPQSAVRSPQSAFYTDRFRFACFRDVRHSNMAEGEIALTLGSIHNLPRGWAMMILRGGGGGSLFFPTMI